MPFHSFLRLGKVSEENKEESVLFSGSEKFFGIGEAIVTCFVMSSVLWRICRSF